MSEKNLIASFNDEKRGIGELFQEMDDTGTVVIWKIPDFTKKLSGHPDTFYDSTTFGFSDTCWFLRIKPNGDSREASKGYIGLYLYSKGKQDCTISYTLSINNTNGVQEFSYNKTRKLDTFIRGKGKIQFCEIYTLMICKSKLLPADTLTVQCRLRRDNSSLIGDGAAVFNLDQSKRDAAVQTIEDTAVSSISSEFEDAVALRGEFEAMYQTGEFCDFDMKVQDRVFRTHKMVLAARSSPFASMVTHDMKEKKTGMVEIVDCDSETFEDFLKFLYGGKNEVITPKNVISLYEVANKYDVQNLKAKCRHFMMEDLSTELFCDVISLALKHDEKELIKQDTEYFKQNKRNIFLSVKWQIFFMENPTYANELLIKTCD